MAEMLKKNEIYPVEITGYSAEGMGVTRIDGQVVFVAGALNGEKAEVRILKVLKTQAYAKIEHLLAPSPHRIKPDCPYDRKCGGCVLRHMDYEEELHFKRQKVHDALTRLGGAQVDELPIHGAGEITSYRNKALFPVAEVDSRADAGFFRARSHDVVPVERCLIQSENADLARAAVVQWMRRWNIAPYDEGTFEGLVRHIYVRSAFGTGQILVCIVVNGKKVPHERELVEILREKVPGLTTVVLNENTRPGNAVLGTEFRTLWGPGVIEDTLCGLRFRLSPRSFYQVNRTQAEKLYLLAAERAALTKKDILLDLYCGTGTITLVMARFCGQAVGVEIIPAAIDDARENARENGIENVRFFCADAGDAAARLLSEGLRPSVIVVDPPRKGLAEDVVHTIAEMAPERVVYVSCDPATLGRDVRRFAEEGYTLRTADAVDLFPRTEHVETVVLLVRKTPDAYVRIKMDMGDFDLTKSETKATYEEIKAYILDKYGVKVSSLYIAQVKEKIGIKERENYNKPKNADAKQPLCPKDKEQFIIEALNYFRMI